MLIGATACENKSNQTESEQDIIEQQIEKENFTENNDIDSANETVTKELEISQNMTDKVKAIDMEGETESNILIAYFSQVGNMDFDKNIDAVASASVNMNGNNVYGNKKGAYDTGVEEERFIGDVQEWYQQKEGKTVGREEVVDAINNLYEVKVVDFNSGNIFLKEHV